MAQQTREAVEEEVVRSSWSSATAGDDAAAAVLLDGPARATSAEEPLCD